MTLCYALTSLSPSTDKMVETKQLKVLKSWVAAGLAPVVFCHPSELSNLTARYAGVAVQWVPVEKTSIATFGKHYIPISEMARWAAGQDAYVVIINADIEVLATPLTTERICRANSAGGICYIIRYNHAGNVKASKVEPYGIDAFLFHSADAKLIPDSYLSMGQPWWDYWLPLCFQKAGRPLLSVEFPYGYHLNHARAWSDAHWLRGAAEVHRMFPFLPPGAALTAATCQAGAVQLRSTFNRTRTQVRPVPITIYEWLKQNLSSPKHRTIFELGAYDGKDTAVLAALPGTIVHSFEPDPRNKPAELPNVVRSRSAIAATDGPVVLQQSAKWGKQLWSASSSIRAPKNHLQRYREVTFQGSVVVEGITLDTYCKSAGVDAVDFIWADLQGAEVDMIRGGAETLARTHYLYTEYSDEEMYEGQISLKQILEMLPNFKIIEKWKEDVLLENTGYRP